MINRKKLALRIFRLTRRLIRKIDPQIYSAHLVYTEDPIAGMRTLSSDMVPRGKAIITSVGEIDPRWTTTRECAPR
jgi:uncharacterized protein (UPF0276 family)